MLKKLKALGNGLYRWKFKLWLDGRQIHEHHVLTEPAAYKLHGDLLEAKARAKSKLPYVQPTKQRSLAEASAAYESELFGAGKSHKHVRDSVRSIALLRKLVGDAYPVAQVTREHIALWMAERRKVKTPGKNPRLPKARTVNKARAELRAFFTSEGVSPNPVSMVRRDKEAAPPVRFMPWEHFERYADYFWKRRPALALFVELLGETGARWNEIQTATGEGIDKKRRVRRAFVKPGRWVDVPAGPWLLAASRRVGGGLLAPREDGKAFAHQAFKRAFRAAARDLKLPAYMPHAIRAGRAVWDLEAGVPIWVVRDKLGHTSVQTTEKYLRAARASAHFGKAPIRARICPKQADFDKAWQGVAGRGKKERTSSKVRVRQWLERKARA